MRKPISLFLLPILLVYTIPALAAPSPQEAAKTIQQSHAAVTPLTNLDVLRMVKAEFTVPTILAQIDSSPCDFVTTPAALQQLKEESVPDPVILAMVMSPKGGPMQNHSLETTALQKNVRVKIPSGLMIELEAPFSVSSQDVKEGDSISFRVVNPVKVDGAVVIAAGATATARVVKASRGGHFGLGEKKNAWQCTCHALMSETWSNAQSVCAMMT